LNSRRRILFICVSLGGGGAERIAALLLEHLDREKFEPHLVIFRDWREYDVPQDVPISCLHKKSWFDFPKLIWRLLRIYREWKPNTIICFGNYENVIAIFAQKLFHTKVKMLLTQHFLPTKVLGSIKNPLKLLFMKWIPGWFYPSVDKVICVSKLVAKDAEDYYGVPIEKTRVIYNPVDINRISTLAQEEVDHPWFTNRRDPIIISVGQLITVKGYPYLLKAFAQVSATIPSYLAILGEGSERRTLVAMARELGIENRVAFLGFQKNPFKYMVRSDCFVLASLMEGSPMVITEALACGIPVVSTRCHSGFDEIIADGKEGLLVPPASEEALAQAMLRVLSDRNLAASLARAGKKRARDFSIGKVVKKYEELFI